MAFIQFGTVGQNIITLAVIAGVFYFIYKSMKEGKAKHAIGDLFEKLKEKKDE